MGDGPLYGFYTPYHLCHFEAPMTAARAVLFGDAGLAPLAGPVCDVVTTAKRDLRAGEVLDGIGGFMTYGEPGEPRRRGGRAPAPDGPRDGLPPRARGRQRPDAHLRRR